MQVIDLLDTAPAQTSAVAAATMYAADRRFRKLTNDPLIGLSFWLLARVTWAARGDFITGLQQLGIQASSNASAIGLVAQVSDRLRRELDTLPSSGHFKDIAELSLRQALTETIGQQGPSLFASSLEDAQRAFRTYSTGERFGDLARRFFAGFVSRSLRSFVDRELANHIGEGAAMRSVRDSRGFLDALDLHARQASRIVEEFAGGWYSRHNWESRGEISPDEAQRFAAYALQKLRTELKRGG